jgi:hypothetical protein
MEVSRTMRISRIFTLLATIAVVFAASGPAWAANGARFGGSVYTGSPNLPLTVSLVTAGGGPSTFKTTTLVTYLAGDKTQAELNGLTQKFGAANVTSFVNVFDFVISDSLALATKAGVTLPAADPNVTDGKSLAAALYAQGNDNGHFNVEYMLDGLVTHPIHVQVMKDIDAKYGAAADANYHAVLTQAMTDLKGVYGL